MQMNAAMTRVLGKPLTVAGNHLVTVETIDVDPPGPGEVQKRRTSPITFRQINEGFDRLADCAVPPHTPRPRA